MQQMSAVSPNIGPSDPASTRYVQVSNKVERYDNRKSVILGILQIVIGVLCIIFNAVAIGVSSYAGVGVVGHGFWSGILFIITGVFGVKAGQLKTKCLIIAFMVLCIISANCTIVVLAFGILGAVITPTRICDSYGYYNSYPYYSPPCRDVPAYQGIVAMEALLAIFGFIEAIIAIWGSVICCKSGVCCCGGPATMVVMPTVGYHQNNGQLICVAQGGQFAYPSYPMMSYPQGMSPPPAYGQQVWVMNPQQPLPTTASAPMIGQQPPGYYTVAPHSQTTDKTTHENF